MSNEYLPRAFIDTDKLFRQQRENTEILAGRRDAEGVFNHLMQRVKSFESEIEENQEVGIRLANYGVAELIHVRAIAFKNPNIVEFSGIIGDDQSVKLIQHISQLNFLLVAVKPVIEGKPYRVGFIQR